MHRLRLSLLTAQSPAAVEEILDRENKRMADSLASKVTRLKSVSGGLPFISTWHSGVGTRGRVESGKGFR